MPNSKSKMISIRVSADDYELLKNERTSRGIRTVSEFAREALRRVMGTPATNQSGLQAELQMLDSKLKTLQGEVSLLSRMVAEGLLGKIKD
jgi:hypothetical protein